jgi:hypothetical protein
MKVSKTTIPVVAFAVGACVFVSTAFADMTLGTGYDRMKDSIKSTAEQMETELDNFTLEATITMKSNDVVLFQQSVVNKVDAAKGATEGTETSQFGDQPAKTTYTYTDREHSIWKYHGDETYYVSDVSRVGDFPLENGRFTNPFKTRGAAEFERIVDAFVGNLKDQVQVEETAEGDVLYSGSLSEAQVPAVVNAVASFGVMQLINEQVHSADTPPLPELASDVYVKSVTGAAVENEDGWLEQASGEVTLVGRDEAGNVHDLKASVLVRVTDAGTTTVTAPDLTAATVEKVGRSGIDEKYVGTYRNDIVVEKDGAFRKVGERTLVIASADGDRVTGTYSEKINPEFVAEYGESYDIAFDYAPDAADPMPYFEYVDGEGERKYGQLSPGGAANLYLMMGLEMTEDGGYRSDEERPFFNGEFSRVFEE